MVLVDTSVWIDHFRTGNEGLISLLEQGLVSTNEYILGELACGNFENRAQMLRLINNLPKSDTASYQEVLGLIEEQKLYGLGLGWIDLNILASYLLSGFRLWTLDQSLHKIAKNL